MRHVALLACLLLAPAAAGQPDDAEARAVAALKRLGATVELNRPKAGPAGLILIGNKVTDAALKELPAFRGLTYLHLTVTSVTDAGLKDVAVLADLEQLDVRGGPVTGAGLADLTGMKRLTRLAVVGDRVDGPGVTALARLAGLKRLDLRGEKVGDADLAPLAGLRALEELHLGVSVTDTGLKHLAGLPRLRKLTVAGGSGRVTGAGLKALAGLPDLRELGLYDPVPVPGRPRRPPTVSDDGLKGVGELKQLEQLWLTGCKGVTDAGLPALHGLKALCTLDVRGTAVTADGVAALRKALPGATVHWDGEPKK